MVVGGYRWLQIVLIVIGGKDVNYMATIIHGDGWHFLASLIYGSKSLSWDVYNVDFRVFELLNRYLWNSYNAFYILLLSTNT